MSILLSFGATDPKISGQDAQKERAADVRVDVSGGCARGTLSRINCPREIGAARPVPSDSIRYPHVEPPKVVPIAHFCKLNSHVSLPLKPPHNGTYRPTDAMDFDLSGCTDWHAFRRRVCAGSVQRMKSPYPYEIVRRDGVI